MGTSAVLLLSLLSTVPCLAARDKELRAVMLSVPAGADLSARHYEPLFAGDHGDVIRLDRVLAAAPVILAQGDAVALRVDHDLALLPAALEEGSKALRIPLVGDGKPSAFTLTSYMAGALEAHIQRRDVGSAHEALLRFDGAVAAAGKARPELAPAFAEMLVRLSDGSAPPLPAFARGVRFRFVRGFMGNRIDDYMDENVERLRAEGLDAEFIDIDTEGGRELGLEAIRRTVEESPDPVALIGHSRGGNHIHDAFRRMPESLRRKVAAVLLLQPAIGGSPVADWALENLWPGWASATTGVVPRWAEIRKTIGELSTAARREVLGALPPLLEEDLAKIFVVSSSFEASPRGGNSLSMILSRWLIERIAGSPSDGWLPVDSASVPGAHHLHLEDVNHEHLVLKEPGWFKWLAGSRPHPELSPGDATIALVHLMFRRG